MNILYHQYGTGNDYGADHHLTNNWDPDFDYGNEYVNVYFNIDTPSYDADCSFESKEMQNLWSKEASNLISSFGILEDSGYSVENGKDKRAYLYAHPQQISGIILKNDVKKIAEAVSSMKYSSLRWVNLYATVYEITDEEYEEFLTSKDTEIKQALFDGCHTTRTTKYYNVFDVCRDIAGRFRLKRLGINDGTNFGSGQTIEHIMKLIDQMSAEGLLIIRENKDHEKYVRSLNKSEQKKANVDSKQISFAF